MICANYVNFLGENLDTMNRSRERDFKSSQQWRFNLWFSGLWCHIMMWG